MKCSAVLFFCWLPFPAFAASKSTLTVYTYSSFSSKYGPGKAIKESFEKSCDCEVKYVDSQEAGAILARLKLEGKDTKADVVVGLDGTLAAEAGEEKILTPLNKQDFAGIEWPQDWPQPLTMIPYEVGVLAFMVDTQKVKVVPKTFEEFLNQEDLKQAVAVQDPRTSSPGLGLLLWMRARFGDRWLDAVKKLKKQVLTTSKSWSASYGMMSKGEVKSVFSYTTSELYHKLEEKTDRYHAVLFSDGHYLQIGAAGIVARSTKQDLGKKFLQHLITTESQRRIATSNWMYPVIPLEIKEWNVVVKPQKILSLPHEQIQKHRKEWVKQWINAFANP